MGKASRDKGYRRENQLANMFRDWGLRAERVPLSGGAKRSDGSNGHDLDVWPKSRGSDIRQVNRLRAPLICELKARAKLPKFLDALGDNDILALKADRKETLFVVPERVMKELMTGEME